VRRRRYGRRRTFGRNVALVMGVVAMIVLIAKRRATDDQRARRTQQAAREVGDAVAESYRTARGRFAETQERQTRHATDLSEQVAGGLRAGAESARAASQELIEQAQERGPEEAERSPGEDIRSIIEESVRRSRAGSLREAGELPIEDYDSLNVNQVIQRLGELSVEEIERLQDYEAEHKNRRSLLQRFETRIRSARRS
jgi:polyhydroxyalkanoate synthesis regulator phasin